MAETASIQSLNELRAAALAAISGASTPDALEDVRIAFLGKSGALKKAQQDLFAKASKEEKKALGQAFNPLQTELQAAVEARQAELGTVASASATKTFDYTRPGKTPARGRLHPLTQTIDEVVDIFRRMGFAVEDGPEIEDEFHSFDALNIPEGHLARDPKDNFTLAQPGKFFRSQTSTVQIRVMQTQAPPIRCIVPGRVYRPDRVDATHHFMFHQVEGLVIGEKITFRDLKACLSEFLHAYYAGQDFEWRLRPHFFPFTEPSAEVDVRMKGSANWLEMLGCGMVDPNVLAAVNIDAEKYTGFAFGMGVERLTILKTGIPVDGDPKPRGIRHFTDNDIRFLRQF